MNDFEKIGVIYAALQIGSSSKHSLSIETTTGEKGVDLYIHDLDGDGFSVKVSDYVPSYEDNMQVYDKFIAKWARKLKKERKEDEANRQDASHIE